jgi:hypothetical protein
MPNPHRDHILVHLLTKAHARVIPLGDDIGDAVIRNDLDVDVRILRLEAAPWRARE